MSGFETLLLLGLAADLNAAGIGVWKDTGAYAAAETGIVLAKMPQSPDRVIVLTAYDVRHSPDLSDSVQGVQVRTRWGGQDPAPVQDLDALIFDQWHGRFGWDLSNGVHVVDAFRRSSTSLGQDGNDRWERSSNYYMSVHRPSPHRT